MPLQPQKDLNQSVACDEELTGQGEWMGVQAQVQRWLVGGQMRLSEGQQTLEGNELKDHIAENQWKGTRTTEL